MGAPEPPLVLLVTVWREGRGVRARIVHGDRSASSTRVCGSVPDLSEAVRELVETWLAGSSGQPELP